jgi:hypothetical protein
MDYIVTYRDENNNNFPKKTSRISRNQSHNFANLYGCIRSKSKVVTRENRACIERRIFATKNRYKSPYQSHWVV